MKKTYIIPEISVAWLRTEKVIAASGVTSDIGIDYGGVDEEGEKDPATKREHYNVWNDDWRDERDHH